VGLGCRAAPDGIDLLIDLATGDPISIVRRQARQSLRAIQESHRLAGRPVPKIDLPGTLPLEAWYPPRGLTWSKPSPAAHPKPEQPAPWTLEEIKQRVSAGLEPGRYRDLNNSNNQAPGATRMMIHGIQPLALAVAALGDRHADSAAPVLRQLLESPYPLAHYLALDELARVGCAGIDGELVQGLKNSGKPTDTVRFYWTCEALAARNVRSAIPALVPFTTEERPANMHGPAGMGLGYPAAKAVARLARKIEHAEVQRLLQSDNIWIRAGALAGLVEAQAPGIGELLRDLLEEHQPGLIRDHALMGLRILSDSTSPTDS
jgi:hypothetical protein